MRRFKSILLFLFRSVLNRFNFFVFIFFKIKKIQDFIYKLLLILKNC